MTVKLYGAPFSPPFRAVLIVAEALGLPLAIKKIDLAKKEHLTQEFIKINPLHSIPVLDDDGTILVDSHAILTYLVSKYGKDDSLYPKDLVKRALVDAKLHFDTGYAFGALRRPMRAHKMNEQNDLLTSRQTQDIQEVYDFMNTFLEENKWVTGDSLTVADISLYSTITSLENLLPIDNTNHPNLRRWLNDAKTVPFFKVNQPGLKDNGEIWLTITKHCL